MPSVLHEKPIWDILDMERVLAAASRYEHIIPADWDMAIVGEMVEKAITKWLARDCSWMELYGLETRYEDDGESGVIDMYGIFTDNAPELLRGKTFIRDWKTTKGKVDLLWESRLKSSAQGKIYLARTQADVLIYNGVNTYGDTRELVIYRPENVQEDIRSLVMGLDLTVTAWIDAGLRIWPRNGQSCLAFGQVCPYLEDCRKFTMPAAIPQPWNWSPSSISGFQLCPERFRRHRLDRESGAEADYSYSTELGNAFHRAMEEVYRQAFGLPEKPAKEISEKTVDISENQG